MDPFTALSLACGIIQVVDFSTKAVTKCRELYKDGSSSENEDLEEMANHLLSLRDTLSVPSQRSSDELQDLARKCSDTAKDLVKELRKLKTKRPRKKLEVASKAFKTIWKKEAIDEIWKRLCQYRNILDTLILVDLRQRFDLLSVQQSKGFEYIDHKIQTMVVLLAAGPKQFDELAVVIRSENQSIKDHVNDGFQQHRENTARNDHIESFLESLWFDHINRRQEAIAEAHENTFEWIFEMEKTKKDGRPWDDFVQWLKRGQDTYWINGKAGSGKSTLMNYIYQDDRTHNSLRAWAGTKELFTPSFFFWNAGSLMQKSSQGLLRSLLHQVITKYPDLTPPPQQDASKSICAGSGPLTYGPSGAWTERRLQTVLHRVMRQLQESCRICIFIDGLDEFVGDQDALIATLKELQSSEIKLCLSSRPDQPYSDAFGSSATLKLQDLTRADIEIYVLHKLQAPLQALFAENATPLCKAIASRAEGVFLWVVLVVKDMLRGLHNCDSLDQMGERLQRMPSDIEGLYAHMLTNIDKVYQKQAADLFHMALVDLTGSLLDVSLAHYKAFDRISQISIRDAIGYCDKAEKRIPTICAGLLEIHKDKEWSGMMQWDAPFKYLSAPIGYEPLLERAEMARYERSDHVQFIHRTSVDFLRKSEQGKRFMEEISPSSRNPYDSYVRALLAKVSLLGFSQVADKTLGHYWGQPDAGGVIAENFVYEVMEKAALAEQYIGAAQVLLYEDIDCTLTLIHQQTARYPTNEHWCVSLGVCSRRASPALERELLIQSRPSSQSSSVQSCHLAVSEQPKDDRLEWLPDRPVDILGLACSHGLSHYVCHNLELRRDLYDRKTATHLLCCSAWGLRYSYSLIISQSPVPLDRKRGSMRLFGELLKRGANPNFYVNEFSTTIWGEFLSNLKDLSDEDKSACEDISIVFLDHGANVHETLFTEHQHELRCLASLRGRVELDGAKTQNFRTRHERSALYVLRESLSGTPGFKALEHACLSKGAHSFSRYTHIAYAEDGRYFRPYEVTDLQYSRFEAAVKTYNYPYASWKTAESMRLHLKDARQIARIWKEITNDADFDCQDDSDETTSDSAEDFHSCSSRISLSP